VSPGPCFRVTQKQVLLLPNALHHPPLSRNTQIAGLPGGGRAQDCDCVDVSSPPPRCLCLPPAFPQAMTSPCAMRHFTFPPPPLPSSSLLVISDRTSLLTNRSSFRPRTALLHPFQLDLASPSTSNTSSSALSYLLFVLLVDQKHITAVRHGPYSHRRHPRTPI
jgi:hypothetical protein